jgi:hypothetical protein
MILLVEPGGGVHSLYDEMIDLSSLGSLLIVRASLVEPDTDGNWWADLGPVGGMVLGPFAKRSQALEAEKVWLETHLFNDNSVRPYPIG